MTVIVVILTSCSVAIFIEKIDEVKSVIITESDIFLIEAIVIKSICIMLLSLSYVIICCIIGNLYFHFSNVDLFFFTVKSHLFKHVTDDDFFANFPCFFKLFTNDRKARFIMEG